VRKEEKGSNFLLFLPISCFKVTVRPDKFDLREVSLYRSHLILKNNLQVTWGRKVWTESFSALAGEVVLNKDLPLGLVCNRSLTTAWMRYY
jgi:hypothetical protein